MKTFAAALLALGAMTLAGGIATKASAQGAPPAASTTPAANANAQPTPAQRLMGDVAPKMVELTDKVLFGDVWERERFLNRAVLNGGDDKAHAARDRVREFLFPFEAIGTQWEIETCE